MTRVSTAEQANVQHGSLEQQGNTIHRWADDRTESTGIKHKVVEIIEEDVSGRKKTFDKRDGIITARRKIRAREIDVLVIEKVDRFARYSVGTRQVVEEAHEHGVEVFETESGKIDLRDRGSRLGFNIKNMLAEEYSLDLEEKITKKQREARVNNGKDTSTCPMLGLDAHDTMTGKYLLNKPELEIVADFMTKFTELKSFKETVDYCNQRGYKTKVRWTKEKIDRHGNRVPPRKIGGEPFTHTTLRAHLLNSKYRGYGIFKDTWNQFKKLQDENEMVRWEYWHYREFGPPIDPDLLKRVYDVAHDLGRCISKGKQAKDGTHYLLSGALKGWDGSKFEGETIDDHQYYRNNTLKLRVRKKEVEKIVIERVKTYLRESGTLKEVLDLALKSRLVGLPLVEEEIGGARSQVKELETIISRFSESIRQAALNPDSNVADVCAELVTEKKKAETDLTKANEMLTRAIQKRQTIKERFENSTAQDWLKRVFSKFDGESGLRKKRLVQMIVPEVILHQDNRLELRVNPDPSGSLLHPDCHGNSGGELLGLTQKWRSVRDSNPRPSA